MEHYFEMLFFDIVSGGSQWMELTGYTSPVKMIASIKVSTVST